MNKVVVLIFLVFTFSSAAIFAQSLELTDTVAVQQLRVKGGDDPVFNYFGINVHKRVLVEGSITSENPNEIIDDTVDFNTLLSGTSNLYIQIISNDGGSSSTLIGANSEIDSYTATSLTTSQDLSEISNPGDKYILRESMTIADIFGPNNEAGLSGAAPGQLEDVIWVPKGTTYDFYRYNTINNPLFNLTPGWKKEGSGDIDASNDPIYYTQGFYILRKSPDPLSIFVAGYVDTTPVVVPIETEDFYAINEVKAGATLGNSNLYGIDLNNDGDFDDHGEVSPTSPINPQDPDNFVDPEGAGPEGFDVIWMQRHDRSGWDQFFFSTINNPMFGVTPGWKKYASGNTNFGNEPIRSSFYLERRIDKPLNLSLKSSLPESFSSIGISSVQVDSSGNVQIERETQVGFIYSLQKLVKFGATVWATTKFSITTGPFVTLSANAELADTFFYQVDKIPEDDFYQDTSYCDELPDILDDIAHLEALVSGDYDLCILHAECPSECQGSATLLQDMRDYYSGLIQFQQLVCI